RRRHTRSKRDWSSDVCSSDLGAPAAGRRLRFSHALIRDVLYDELSPSRRVKLHREIGEALERLYARDPEPHLAELAHHFSEAARSEERRVGKECRSRWGR